MPGAPDDQPTLSMDDGGPHGPRVFAPGTFLSGRFRIVRFIGQGGMGEVYEAEDVELRERVALKTIRSHIASREDMLARFKSEIQLARKVTHPNVCRIFDLAATRTSRSSLWNCSTANPLPRSCGAGL